ncbi:hypothetical protein RFI_12112 [Reticulomyxa filosa]|uniref:Uncharacterized protein n=1 Tax=Reticulomyxa filosa TaxID=46433 RepID=X6NGK5_RETFI|nr:hypothetical protein RFI_12112 [Reticulomyxa filosa]|eukprot:ETO25033.1 hypothetical protein RFI_12112 [Reticulomyxa filosa]
MQRSRAHCPGKEVKASAAAAATTTTATIQQKNMEVCSNNSSNTIAQVSKSCANPHEWFPRNITTVPSVLSVSCSVPLPMAEKREQSNSSLISRGMFSVPTSSKKQLLASLKEAPYLNHRKKTKTSTKRRKKEHMMETQCSGSFQASQTSQANPLSSNMTGQLQDSQQLYSQSQKQIISLEVTTDKNKQTTTPTTPTTIMATATPTTTTITTPTTTTTTTTTTTMTTLTEHPRKRQRREMENDGMTSSPISDKSDAANDDIIWSGGKKVKRVALEEPKIIQHRNFPFVCLQTHLDIPLDGSTNNNHGLFHCCMSLESGLLCGQTFHQKSHWARHCKKSHAVDDDHFT